MRYHVDHRAIRIEQRIFMDGGLGSKGGLDLVAEPMAYVLEEIRLESAYIIRLRPVFLSCGGPEIERRM
ncbi:uncharacterized protein G2W53_009626 [Senna tora]|uniref:Uncharacterized protein n=1 Tax=Senna tora TaxID=362788 RepID=A0A835CCZ8_9FABA|nr:uncharacterized protein G2W53_009626 [Senna tora]